MKLTAKATAALVLPTDKNDHIEWDEDLKRFGYRLRKIGDKVARSWSCSIAMRVTPGA